MAEKNILKIVCPGANGVNAVLDITKLTETSENLKQRIEWLESGSRQFALKDYSQAENQGEMVAGVYYYVAFDQANTFLPPDEHGNPTGDIHHFDIYMKGDDGTVTFIARQYTQSNLQNVAYTNKLAIFEAGIQKKIVGDYDSLTANDLVAKGEVDVKLAGINADLDKITNVIGENAENAALINKENTFQFKQNIALTKSDTKETSSLKGLSSHFDRATATFDDDTTETAFGVFLEDKTGETLGGLKTTARPDEVHSHIYVQNSDGSAQGSIKVTYNKTANTFTATAPSTAEGAVGQEIVTADWANEKIGSIEDSLQDATDVQRGFVKLSDAINSDLDAPTGKTAATPKAVKTVNDALTAVTTVIGTNAENAALINKANVFAESQTIAGKDNGTTETASLNFQAKTFKNADNLFTGAQTSATLATNLTAGDDNSVISTVEHVVDTTNRTVNVAVVDDGLARHGITIQSNHTGDQVRISLTDSTPESATGTEIVTADYVANKIGDLDPEHVAYTNKENQFTEAQILVGKLSGTYDGSLLVGKSANYDHVAKTFDNSVTTVHSAIIGTDKNDVQYGSIGITADAVSVRSSIAIKSADGSADAGVISVNRNATTNKIRTSAPTPDIADVEKQEIVTAGLLAKALTGNEDGDLETVLPQLQNIAYVNKANTFTETNTFVTGDSSVTIGGAGINTGDDDSDLVLGAGTANVTLSPDNHFTRPEMPGDAGETEVTTKKYVDDQIIANATPDATTEVKGKVELATDNEVATGADGVVPTAKQVKAALDAKIVVTSDELQATQSGVLYLIIEA